MHDRRELVLRLVQALGLAWIALALCFYFVSRVDAGPRHLADRLAARTDADGCVAYLIHWFLGHPDFGERILIVGSGDSAVEIAREVLSRRTRVIAWSALSAPMPSYWARA